MQTVHISLLNFATIIDPVDMHDINNDTNEKNPTYMLERWM